MEKKSSYPTNFPENDGARITWFHSGCSTQEFSGKLYYPMTSVKINGEMGCWELRNFATPSDLHFHRPWDKSKNLYPLGNHIILNKAIARTPGTPRPADSWFLHPKKLPRWQLCDFSICMGSLYNEGVDIFFSST